MNHAASSVLHILAQNASGTRGVGKNQAKPAAEPQAPAGVGGNNKVVAPKRRHLLFDLIVLGAIGGASYALWYHLSESPSNPNQ